MLWWQQEGAFFFSCPADELLLQPPPPSLVEQQHFPLQQHDDSEVPWPVQNGLTVPSGQRQVKCRVLPKSDEAAVAQTSKAVTVLCNRRIASPHTTIIGVGPKRFKARTSGGGQRHPRTFRTIRALYAPACGSQSVDSSETGRNPSVLPPAFYAVFWLCDEASQAVSG